MPDSENNPSPEDLQVEEFALLTSLVDHGVFEHELIVNVLVYHIRKQTLPGGPDGVVHCREHVREEHLTTISVLGCEPDLCEDQKNILVEVVAHQEGDSAVAPASMDQDQA